MTLDDVRELADGVARDEHAAGLRLLGPVCGGVAVV